MNDRVFDTRPDRKKLPPREVPAPLPDEESEQFTDETLTEEQISEEVNEAPHARTHHAPAHHTKEKAHRHGN